MRLLSDLVSYFALIFAFGGFPGGRNDLRPSGRPPGREFPPRQMRSDICASKRVFLNARFYKRILLRSVHALLRDEQHSRAEQQDRADHIEQRRAHAAGSGKYSASAVANVRGLGQLSLDNSPGIRP